MSHAYNCVDPNCPECMHGWTPPPPPVIGSPQWKDATALQWANAHRVFDRQISGVWRVPPISGHPIGLFVVHKLSSGYNYFRVDDFEAQP